MTPGRWLWGLKYGCSGFNSPIRFMSFCCRYWQRQRLFRWYGLVIWSSSGMLLRSFLILSIQTRPINWLLGCVAQCLKDWASHHQNISFPFCSDWCWKEAKTGLCKTCCLCWEYCITGNSRWCNWCHNRSCKWMNGIKGDWGHLLYKWTSNLHLTQGLLSASIRWRVYLDFHQILIKRKKVPRRGGRDNSRNKRLQSTLLRMMTMSFDCTVICKRHFNALCNVFHQVFIYWFFYHYWTYRLIYFMS